LGQTKTKTLEMDKYWMNLYYF